MENQEPRTESHEDVADQPTQERSEPKTTSDEPALNSEEMGDKYMSDTDNERG